MLQICVLQVCLSMCSNGCSQSGYFTLVIPVFYSNDNKDVVLVETQIQKLASVS